VQEALLTISQSRSVAAGREDKSSGLSTGAIVGIAVAVLLAVVILLVAYRYKE
jgi:tetrahydromethanopterin S-methyltransferase subunit F